ncbi:hypothetical protein N8725_02170 [Alphaproteobacteria bacterium]|nr:hypothetical protein [Alphaproteobacteria bacterium]
MKIFCFLFLIIFSFKAYAHECVLQGTSAKDITIYNACKSDLKKNGHSNKALNNALMKNKIKKLKEENKLLKNQLLDIKVRLKSIINNIQSYVY